MKNILIFSILLCMVIMPSFAELTDADLDKIRLIVKEEIKTEIESSEKGIKEYIDTKNESVEKRLSLVTTLIIGLIALVVLSVGIPQIIIAWRSVKDSSQDKIITREQAKELIEELIEELTPEDRKIIEERIRDQEQQIKTLTQEIDALKNQQITNP